MKPFLRTSLIFLGIIAVVAVAWLAWNKYLSPSAQTAREMEKNYQTYHEWEQRYYDALASDTYGGKTPEDTLRLFIDALEQEDIELASKYFMYDTSISKQQWVDWLNGIKDAGNLQRFADDLKKAEKGNSISKDDIGFVLRNNDGTVGFGFRLKFNSSTAVWKIEEM
jgi:hypothetical protein